MIDFLKNRLSFTACLIITIVAISSCETNTVYDEYRHTQISGWDKNDSLFFDIQPIKEGSEYNESVGIRINNAYPFMSLCIIIKQDIVNRKISFTDTLNCRLIDKEGSIKGHGISNYQYKFYLKKMKISQGDSLHITIHHNMKREILPGISDIGLSLTKD